MTFLTFHFGAGNQALEALGNPGGAVPSGNPGRGQARTAHRLLWYPVRTPLGKPNWGKMNLSEIFGGIFGLGDYKK